MEHERVGSVTMSDLALDRSRQVDDGDGIHWAFLIYSKGMIG